MSLSWPWALAALLVVPVLLLARWWANKRRKRAALRVSSVALIRAALPGRSQWRRRIPVILFLAGLLALAGALTRPQASLAVPSTESTIMLAIDVSGSMCATDVAPNRLTAATAAAKKFVEDQDGRTPIGLVAFSGIAALLVPPTTDQQALLKAIDGLTTARGTAIGQAILTAIDAVAEVNPDVPATGVDLGDGPPGTAVTDYEPDTIVILTDGANTRGVDPVTAAEQAAASGALATTTEHGTWVAPANRVTWTPPGFDHSHRFYGRADVRVVAIPVAMCNELVAHPWVFTVSPLLRETLPALKGRRETRTDVHERLRAVVIDELAETPAQSLHLPEPRDYRLRTVTDLLHADPGRADTLVELGRAAGASERSLSRLLQTEFPPLAHHPANPPRPAPPHQRRLRHRHREGVRMVQPVELHRRIHRSSARRPAATEQICTMTPRPAASPSAIPDDVVITRSSSTGRSSTGWLALSGRALQQRAAGFHRFRGGDAGNRPAVRGRRGNAVRKDAPRTDSHSAGAAKVKTTARFDDLGRAPGQRGDVEEPHRHRWLSGVVVRVAPGHGRAGPLSRFQDHEVRRTVPRHGRTEDLLDAEQDPNFQH
jgi:AraC-like DNA-binding protein